MRDKIKEALEKVGVDNPLVEIPVNETFGDYTTNAALISAKREGKPSVQLAKEIIKKLGKIKNIDKIETTPNGFINFWLSKEYLTTLLDLKLEPKRFLVDKKIMVEFTDPNPFKEFHIGHLYSNIVGESISRLLEQLGANVARVNYQGDVGLHVAKAVWGMKKDEENLKHYENKPADVRAQFLGKAYARGAKAYEEDEKAKKDIEELNKKIYRGDKEIKALYDKGRKWSLEYFEEIYKRLGTKFDFYYFESRAGKTGLDLVRRHMKVFEESQGAVIFPGEKYGLHNRVFISSQGLPTYEAKELGLAPTKYKDFAYDQSIIVTGNEIVEYFKVVKVALGRFDPEIADKTKHISHGMVRFPGGKISSRLGNVLDFGWLVKNIKDRIKENFEDMDEVTLEKVALGAIKYALLRARLGTDIEFDYKRSISLEGDSGPYLQYAYVRTQSVLKKSARGPATRFPPASAPSTSSVRAVGIPSTRVTPRFSPEELSVLRSLVHFPEIIEQASMNYSPNILCAYLFDLCQKFNLFYQKQRILGSKNEEFRLKLTETVGLVIKSGLYLLGIATPKKM